MDIRTAILALILVASLIIFGVGMFGMSYGEERQATAIDMQEATRIVLANFPNARILEMELGRLVYGAELVTVEGQKKELHVNATTGQIEQMEHD